MICHQQSRSFPRNTLPHPETQLMPCGESLSNIVRLAMEQLPGTQSGSNTSRRSHRIIANDFLARTCSGVAGSESGGWRIIRHGSGTRYTFTVYSSAYIFKYNIIYNIILYYIILYNIILYYIILYINTDIHTHTHTHTHVFL